MVRDATKSAYLSPTAVSLLPANEAATVAYHRGLYSFRKDTTEGFTVAEIALNDAITTEPLFARAHAALARVLWAIGDSGARPLRACTMLALQSARHALTLAPNDSMDVNLTKARLLDPLLVDPLHGRITLCMVSHDYAAALALTDHVNLHRLYRLDSLSVG